MKYKILLFLTVVCLCFVFSLNCLAYNLDNDYLSNSGEAIGGVEFVTPTEMLSYINDYTVAFSTDNGTILNVVFYVSNYTQLHNKIIEYYQTNGGTVSFANYINFDINYQSLINLLHPDITSNFNSFVSYLNGLADAYVTNQHLIHELQIVITDFNTLQSSYQNLLSLYNSLDADFENLNITYNQLVENYNSLVAEKNALSNQYNLLQSDYENLLNSYDLRLSEIDTLNQEILFLEGEIETLEYEYELLLDEASRNYQEGVYDGMIEGETMTNGLISIFGAPMYVFGEVFDFEVLGINILSLIKFVLTISIIGYVILKLRS